MKIGEQVMNREHLRSIFVSVCLGSLGLGSTQAQPIFTTQPRDQYVNASSNVTMSVQVSGNGPFAFQWLFNGAAKPGATKYNLVVTNAQPSDSGGYAVVVANSGGSVTSRVARLKVFVPALHAISAIQLSAGRSVTLTLAGETSLTFAAYSSLYPIEVSSNLLDWGSLVTLQRPNTALEALQLFDLIPEGLPQRYYRTPTNALPTPGLALTGPYSVGTFSMLLTDPSRTNTIQRTNHQFMITFWYPAVPQAGVLPAAYVERQVAARFDLSTGGGGNFSSQVATFSSHSLSNAPPVSSLKCPVLLYSQGLSSQRRDNADKAEHLASWGYVVIGVDNRHTYISVFPDGTVVSGEPPPTSTDGAVAAIEDWLKDLQFVLAEVEEMNTTQSLLAGHLDLDKIGAFGWSLGGATAAQLCLRDPRCKAGVGMDGSFFETNLLTQTLSAPYLFLRADTGGDPQFSGDDRWPVFNHLVTNAFWVKLRGTIHSSFSDAPLIFDSMTLNTVWGTPASGQNLDPARGSQIIRAYLLSFFNKYLRGEDDHLLDGPSPDYPEVMQFIRK
jgi:dienelactone hydrolase